MKPTLLLVKEVAQELGVGVHPFDVHTGKDIPRIESAKCCGPIWNESNGSIRRRSTGNCARQSTRSPGGDSRRRAQLQRPKPVKRGHLWPMVGQESFIMNLVFELFLSEGNHNHIFGENLRKMAHCYLFEAE
jgi:hypothetical protein